jgi:hypothetical protein
LPDEKISHPAYFLEGVVIMVKISKLTVALMCTGIAFSQAAEAGIWRGLKCLVERHLGKRVCEESSRGDRMLQQRYADFRYFRQNPRGYVGKTLEVGGAKMIVAGVASLGAGYALDTAVASDSPHKNTAEYVSSGAKSVGANVAFGGAGLTYVGAALRHPKMVLLATTVGATFWAALHPDACLKKFDEIRARLTPSESRNK